MKQWNHPVHRWIILINSKLLSIRLPVNIVIVLQKQGRKTNIEKKRKEERGNYGCRETSRRVDKVGIRPPGPAPPRRRPTPTSKSGLFSSNMLVFCWAGATGGCHRGLIGLCDIDVKWLISLVVGEPGASGMSSISFGFCSPACPGISAEGSGAADTAGS